MAVIGNVRNGEIESGRLALRATAAPTSTGSVVGWTAMHRSAYGGPCVIMQVVEN